MASLSSSGALSELGGGVGEWDRSVGNRQPQPLADLPPSVPDPPNDQAFWRNGLQNLRVVRLEGGDAGLLVLKVGCESGGQRFSDHRVPSVVGLRWDILVDGRARAFPPGLAVS